MKKHILTIILLCPVMTIKQNCKELDINPDHLYHEEREALVKISKERLFEVLGEDAAQANTDCFETEDNLTRTNLDDL
jgi:hypothetical protein